MAGRVDTPRTHFLLELTESSRVKLPPEPDPLPCKEKKTQYVSQFDTTTGPDPPAPVTLHGLSSGNLEVRTRQQDSYSSVYPCGELPLTAMSYDDRNDHSTGSRQDESHRRDLSTDPEAAGTGPTQITQPAAREDDTIVDKVVKKLAKGEGAIFKREEKLEKKKTAAKRKTAMEATGLSAENASQRDSIQTTISRLGLHEKAENPTETILAAFETAFVQAYKDCGTGLWQAWYFAGCYGLLRHELGLRPPNQKLDRRANGVRVLHRIVNKLLQTHGIRALMVLCAAAGNVLAPTPDDCFELTEIEKGYQLYHPGHASENDQNTISDRVAKRLSEMKKFRAPPKDHMIACPTFWISHYTPTIRSISPPFTF